jgi:hypothetical protein
MRRGGAMRRWEVGSGTVGYFGAGNETPKRRRLAI